MKQFLYWGQVQQRLSEHVAQGNQPYSFYDAVCELQKEGEFQTAAELPIVSFEDWNVDDLDELERLLNCTPVDINRFSSRSKAQTRSAVLHALKLEGAPIRIAVDQAMGNHAHSVFRILYVVQGEAQLDFGSTVHILSENTVCIVAPSFYHDVVAQPGSLLLSIALSDQTVEDTLYKLLRQDNAISDFFRFGLGGAHGGCLLLHPDHNRQIRSVYRGILHECYTKGEYSRDIYLGYLEILFAMLLRYSTSYESLETQAQGALPMLSILKYIQTHYKETSLGEVAELFHYEPSYLGKQIKASTGRNYTDIVRELRINEAKELLEETELSMDEVAEQAGYDSRVHFFRNFRAAVGITPGEYRKQLRKKT